LDTGGVEGYLGPAVLCEAGGLAFRALRARPPGPSGAGLGREVGKKVAKKVGKKGKKLKCEKRELKRNHKPNLSESKSFKSFVSKQN